MAVGKNEIQVTWPTAAESISVAAGTNKTSEVITFSTTAPEALIQLKAKNDGTPTSGDTIDFYLLPTLGDPDGAGADEYDTTGHAIFLAQLDTNTEDPALRTVNIPVAKGGKVYAVSNAASNAITVSACIYETTVS